MFVSSIKRFSDLSTHNLFELGERSKDNNYRILYEKIKSPSDRFLYGLEAFILTLTGIGLAFSFVRKRWEVALYGKITHYVNEESLPKIIQRTNAFTQDFFNQEINSLIYDESTLKDLLRFDGIDLNCNNATGLNPLHLAVNNNQLNIFHLLLDRKVNINARSGDNWTALHVATSKGNVEAIKLLLSNGADVKEKDAKGSTALHLAEIKGNQEVIDMLINQ
jgi:hypothetical protein